MEFKDFKIAVAKRFAEMSKHTLLRTDTTKDEIWQTYINGFPPGTNPIYRERTEHDCQCCKQFIRSVGNAVAIIDGKLVSIWDVTVNDSAYQQVADRLSAYVLSKPIKDFFLSEERTAGTDQNFEDTLEGVKTWNHFHVNIPANFVFSKHVIPTKLGELRALHDVLYRSIMEIKPDAIDTALELILQGSLYRGEEHKSVLTQFKIIQDEALKLDIDDRDMFVWSRINSTPAPVCKIRNTAIGTLLVDLSEDKDLEYAVKAFERVMAPANYKRPTALVTKSMIEAAKKTVEELGLLSALTRRYATVQDITVNNLLFVNRDTKRKIEGSVFDDMLASVPVSPKTLDKVDDVTIDQFINHILPSATSVELLLENKHSGNLMSLITAVDPTATKMFKWDNQFSWTYSGDVTDSIKERVKAAGGNVTGELCIRLAWDYTDDLDLHMEEPYDHIYFGNGRRNKRPSGGQLDLDANGMDGLVPNPAENIYYDTTNKMPEGTYRVVVNNYSRRSDGVGFDVEIDLMGEVHSFNYPSVLKFSQNVAVANIIKNKDGITVKPLLPTSVSSKTVWGLQTNQWQKVNAVMLSPNFWDDRQVGNKHFFFMLDGCANEGVARGFYNEFLIPDLDKHRKALEMVGSKVKTATSAEQLSGLGFSSTQKGSVKCRVNGSFSRVINIVF